MIAVLVTVFSFTLFLGYLFLPTAVKQDHEAHSRGDALATSMIRFHERAVEMVDASPSSFVPGTALPGVSMRYPYSSIGAWRAQVVIADGNLGILTHPSDFTTPAGDANDFYEDLLLSLEHMDALYNGSHTGAFSNTVPLQLDGVLISAIATHVPDDTPVLLTRISAQPTAP